MQQKRVLYHTVRQTQIRELKCLVLTFCWCNKKLSDMERWCGRTAVVTGANGGMGSAISVALANAGMNVVALDIRCDLINGLKLQITGKGNIVPKICDISKSEEVTTAFKWIEENFSGVHVLVNCAGVLYQGHITDVGINTLSDDQIHSTIDINLKGSIFCTRHAIKSMKAKAFYGHVININSLAGHYIPFGVNMNVYPTTKHAITAFTASLNTELAEFKNKIKVTSISPGVVSTPMADYVRELELPALEPRDIAHAVLYVLSTPPHLNINELTITPVTEKRL